MNVKANPILETILRRYALVLNQEGLHRVIQVKNHNNYFIKITDDIRKIVEMFDLDFDTFNKLKDHVEFCEYVKTSPYFLPRLFQRERDGDSDSDLINCMRSMIFIDDLKQERKPINTERVMFVMGDNNNVLLSQINYYKQILPLAVSNFKSFFNLMKKLLIENHSYDVRKFSTDLPKFRKLFKSYWEYKIYFQTNHINDIVKKYLETSNVKQQLKKI